MRLLASADLHGFYDVYDWLVETIAARRPGAVVLAGDLLGSPDESVSIEEAQSADRLEVLERLSKIECPLYYVMGNDDLIELNAPREAHRSVHGRRIDHDDVNFVGYQFTLPFMGGVFEKPEEEMAADLARLEPLIDSRTILVTHGPEYGTLDLGILDRHAGSTSLRDMIARTNPLIHIHGHIHREFGCAGRHFNVASAGRKRAMIIDLETMEHEVLEAADRP